MLTHRAAVLGSPVAHSLSPVLHRAAYAALGLTGWQYDRREVRADDLAAVVAELDRSWRGLSLTMPLKEAALAVAGRVDELAALAGAANTLVREDAGWAAYNTDVHGLTRALQEAGAEPLSPVATVLGSGATARSALLALHRLGVTAVTLVVRDRAQPATVMLAERIGVTVSVLPPPAPLGATLVVSTVPSPVAAQWCEPLLGAGPPGTLLDVVYAAGAQALTGRAARRGWRAVDGTRMLLHQAGEQVRLFTGRQPPLAAMAAALDRALGRSDGSSC